MRPNTAVKARTHGGNPWQLMREQGVPTEPILDFSVDLNPLGFPDSVRAAVLDHVEDLRCYPDPDALALREAIAADHDVSPEAILPGNGSAELITLLMRLRPMSKVVVVAPTFTEYAWAAEQAGATVAHHLLEEARGFQPDCSTDLWAQRLRDAELVFLCNPNNPTGVALPSERVRWLAEECRQRGSLLVVDEAYVELTDRPRETTVLPEATGSDHLIVLRSLTKSFAVPGLRLGYLVAAPLLVEALRAMQQPWPLNTFAMVVGAELFAQHEYLARSRQLLRELRGAFHAALTTIPALQVFPTATNFALCKIEAGACPSSQLAQRLAEKRILIRNCDDFTGLEAGRFIRLAIRTPEDNARLLGALREALPHAG